MLVPGVQRRSSVFTKGALGVDTKDAGRVARTSAGTAGRFRSIALILIFDVAAPLLAYKLLHSAGMSKVNALLLSGVFPAISLAIGAIRHRRLDVVGILVLAGIVVGVVLGLLTHSARLLLMEGSVPTAIFAVGCLASLRAPRPLMFAFALEFTGPDTAKGREMTRLWQYDGFRRVFRTITLVWGIGFLVEAAVRVVVVDKFSAGTALAVSKAAPFVFFGILSAWTVAYGSHRKKKSERMGLTSGEAMEASPSQPPAS
jgi:intracellular septation protein A